MTTLADRIVAVASAEIGVAEVPLGSNTGKEVMAFQATCAYSKTQRTRWPWCGAFARWCYRKAGVPDASNPADASTDLMWQLAGQKGWRASEPSVGGLIIWPGIHTGIVVGIGDGVVYTVEGNHGDQVASATRPIAGADFITIPSLGQPVAPPRLYWIDDDLAKYVVLGPWAKEKSAQRAKASLSPAWQRRSEVLRTGDGKWVLRKGDTPRRGPFLDPDKRDASLAILEKSLGRKLVPRSTVSDLPPVLVDRSGAAVAVGAGKTT